MDDERTEERRSDDWFSGYQAAVDDVLAMLDEFDLRRSSLTSRLILRLRADVAGLIRRRVNSAA